MCSELRNTLRCLLAIVCCCIGTAPAQDGKRPDADAALKLAFPDCTLQRVTRTLDEAQRKCCSELAGAEVERATVFAYEARRDGALVGTAYFDRHPVRTKQEVLMVVVDNDGRARRVEVLAFGEPVDYLPRDVFYAQFVGRALDAELSSKQAIRTVVGATLTVEATIAAVRRVLAVHAVTAPKPEPRPEPEKKPEPEQKQKPKPKPDEKPKPAPEPEPQPKPAGGGVA